MDALVIRNLFLGMAAGYTAGIAWKALVAWRQERQVRR